MRQCHGDGVLPRLVDVEVDELVAVIRPHASGRLFHDLGEVVEHPRLVHDEVRELADAVRIVRRARRAHDLCGILLIRAPEAHLGDPVRLLNDLLGEAECLARLDAARLNAVGLADFEASAAALDQSRRDAGELRELGCGDNAGRA